MADRVNELRGILRANRPETPDIATPIRKAVARQASVLRAHQEPVTAFREERQAAQRATDK